MYITIVPLYSLYKLHIHCPEKEKERNVKLSSSQFDL